MYLRVYVPHGGYPPKGVPLRVGILLKVYPSGCVPPAMGVPQCVPPARGVPQCVTTLRREALFLGENVDNSAQRVSPPLGELGNDAQSAPCSPCDEGGDDAQSAPCSPLFPGLKR